MGQPATERPFREGPLRAAYETFALAHCERLVLADSRRYRDLAYLEPRLLMASNGAMIILIAALLSLLEL
jgi:hypothetical protein